jgi:hypothetical protein
MQVFTQSSFAAAPPPEIRMTEMKRVRSVVDRSPVPIEQHLLAADPPRADVHRLAAIEESVANVQRKLVMLSNVLEKEAGDGKQPVVVTKPPPSANSRSWMLIIISAVAIVVAVVAAHLGVIWDTFFAVDAPKK